MIPNIYGEKYEVASHSPSLRQSHLPSNGFQSLCAVNVQKYSIVNWIMIPGIQKTI